MASAITDLLEALFRWLHVFAGITWIGLLYFFNWVNGPFAATLDAEAKKKVVPELMPRALFWFRWGAFWTWSLGVLLLLLVFYHGGLTLPPEVGWGTRAWLMVLFVLAASPFLYELLAKSGVAGNKRLFVSLGFVSIAFVLLLLNKWAGFTYRAYNIHVGAMFGTIMAYNVWFRIWPAQKKIIAAVKAGEAPDPALAATAGTRSRHNTYLSVPLLWTMINAHTTVTAGGNFGLTERTAFLAMLGAVLLGWHIVWHCYNKAGKVKGF